MDYDRNDSKLDESWKEAESGKSSKPNSSTELLNSAENSASSETTDSDVKSLESSPSNLIHYTGNINKPILNAPAKLKGFANLKKSAPVTILLGVIVLAGIGIVLLQNLAPFSFGENAKNMFNTTRTEYNMSSNTLMSSYLEGSATAAEYDPAPDNLYDNLEPSEDLQKSLKNGNIHYTVVGGVKGLLYKDPSSKEWLFATSNSTNAEGLVGQSASIDDDSIVISKTAPLSDAYSSNRNFANALDIGLRPWKSHYAGWYNSTAEMYTSQIGNNRDKFRDLKKNTPTIEEYNEAIKNNSTPVEINDTSGNISYSSCAEDDNDEASCSDEQNTGNDALKPGMDESSVKSALSSRAKKAMTAGKQAASDECKVAKGVAATSAAATGILKIQTMNSGSAFLEAIDKAKVSGDAGAMNAAMHKYSIPGETLALNDDAEWSPVEGKENSSGVDSAAWNYIAGGGPSPSNSDPLVKTFTYESLISNDTYSSRLKESTDYTDGAVERCSSISEYNGAEDLYYNHEGSGVSGGLFSALFDFIAQLFGNNKAYVDTQSDAIAEVEAKRAKAYLDMDIENMSGETGMYAIANGAEAYYGQMQLMVSAQPGTDTTVKSAWQDTQTVIAKEAEVERSILSPFDVTSQNTFLGSIAHKSLPIIAKINAPLKAFTGFLGTTMSSLQSIIPIAGAASAENEYKQSLRDDCQTSKYLVSNNGTMTNNAFCFQKATFNSSTTKTSLRDVYRNILYGSSSGYEDIPNFTGVDSNGNPEVNPNGEYATWLVACSVRKSQWGYLNGQATSFIQEQKSDSGSASSASTAIEKGLEAVNINDITDYESAYSRTSLDWSTGINCMGGRDGSLSNKVALYAQYNTYQNLLETAGSVPKASQIAFLEKYYTNHPYYTNSIEGVIAEYSGLTSDDVELALGLVEYHDYLAHYDPSDLGPASPLPEADPLFFESTSVIAESSILPVAPLAEEISYSDLRTRTLIV